MNENSPDFQLYRWLKSDNGEIGLYEYLGTIVWKEHFETWNDEVRDEFNRLMGVVSEKDYDDSGDKLA